MFTKLKHWCIVLRSKNTFRRKFKTPITFTEVYSKGTKCKPVEGTEPWATYEKPAQTVEVSSLYLKCDVVEALVRFRLFKWSVIICNKIE